MHAQESEKTTETKQGRRAPVGTTAAPAPAGAELMSPGSVLALQRSIGNAAVSRMIDRAPAVARPAAPVVQRAGNWKNNPTKTAVKNLKSSTPAADKAWVETLHHVIPQRRLAWLAGLVDAAQNTLIRTQLGTLAPTAFSSADLATALANIPANYIAGPEPKTRSDDPDQPGGKGDADVNYDGTGTGTVTPRSRFLNDADTWLKAQQAAGATTVSTSELQTHFIDNVRQACTLHGPGVGLSKNRSKYSTDTSGKHYRT